MSSLVLWHLPGKFTPTYCFESFDTKEENFVHLKKMINFFGPTLKFRNSTPFKYHCALNIEDIIYEKFKDIIVNMDIFLAAPMSSMIT